MIIHKDTQVNPLYILLVYLSLHSGACPVQKPLLVHHNVPLPTMFSPRRHLYVAWSSDIISKPEGGGINEGQFRGIFIPFDRADMGKYEVIT